MMNHYDGLSVVAEKKKPSEGSWAWDKIYTVAQGVISHIISESSWSGTAWQTKYYHFDAIGNVVSHTNTSGSLIALFDQDAYGNVKQIYGTGSESGYHLTTKEFDASPELYYFYKRWYEPQIGRFVSKDPKFEINLYPYCRNNPSRNIDPKGESIVELVVCVVIVGTVVCIAIDSYKDSAENSKNQACQLTAKFILLNELLSGHTLSEECRNWLNKASGNGSATNCYCGYLQLAKEACKKDGLDIKIP